jgi:hypothetical protein
VTLVRLWSTTTSSRRTPTLSSTERIVFTTLAPRSRVQTTTLTAGPGPGRGPGVKAGLRADAGLAGAEAGRARSLTVESSRSRVGFPFLVPAEAEMDILGDRSG